MLTAGTAAEVFPGHHEIAWFDFLCEIFHARIIFKRVLGHVFRVGLCKIFIMIDQVGVHVVGKHPRSSFHHAHAFASLRISLGSVMQPRTAVAMADMGLIR